MKLKKSFASFKNVAAFKCLLYKYGILLFLFAFLFIVACNFSHENTLKGDSNSGNRIINSFDNDWKFHKGDIPGVENTKYNDKDWRTLNLPHDWSIEGPYDSLCPNGFNEGYLPDGIGWYRKTFKLPESLKDRKVTIEFDGVYMNSDVWLNGHHLGNHVYGWTAFNYDLTTYLYYGSNENIIAVKVDNSKKSFAWWYTGSGIYRHVNLLITNRTHIDYWGTFVTTPNVSKKLATVNVRTKVVNENEDSRQLELFTYILDNSGKKVDSISTGIEIAAWNKYEFNQNLTVNDPQLWSPENPNLYKVISEVRENDKVIDNYETPLGIRTFYFDANKGFFLNGKSYKLYGTCNHEDFGCLGVALPDRAVEKRILMLKEMGCNAVITSHSPQRKEWYEYCDKYGLLVIDEIWTKWHKDDAPWYTKYWNKYRDEDLISMIERDRNHPSIFMYCLGDEMEEVSLQGGNEIIRKLIDLFNDHDTTRIITADMANFGDKQSVQNKFAAELKVVGYSYHVFRFDKDHKDYPDRVILALQDASALETRGVYHFPVDSIAYESPDKYCSSYDRETVPWGTLHRTTCRIVKKREWIAGEFIWSGFDYIGEPTPYAWPAKSSFFGVIDLAGFPKDGFYFYQSKWTKKPMVHILPHWNWPGKEGSKIDIWCYTNCESAELILNGKSLGIKTFTTDTINDLNLSWKVPYSPGTLKVKGIIAGKVACSETVKTSGLPASIKLDFDRSTIKSDGEDCSFGTITVLDKGGNFVPDAKIAIKFKVEGEGKIIGVDNGDQHFVGDMKADQIPTFNGLARVIIQSTGKSGKISISASSQGNMKCSAEIITE
jgi:beta-galactosidase